MPGILGYSLGTGDQAVSEMLSPEDEAFRQALRAKLVAARGHTYTYKNPERIMIRLGGGGGVPSPGGGDGSGGSSYDPGGGGFNPFRPGFNPYYSDRFNSPSDPFNNPYDEPHPDGRPY